MTILPKTFRPFAVAAVAALAAFGVAQAAQAAGITVTLTDGVISPQRVEVPAGKAVTLTVRNAGKGAAEFESKRLHVEQVIAPGATAIIKLRPLPKGHYKFVEEFHENQASGRGLIVAK